MSDQGSPAAPFLPEAHRLRGVAILAVMLGHIAPRVFDLHTSPAARVLSLLTRNGTVWFVFLSGMLLQHLSARFRYVDHLRARADQVLVPYVLWSSLILAWMALDVRPEPPFWMASWSRQSEPVRGLLYLATGAHLEQLWYVPVATVFFVGTPLWLWLGRSRGLLWLLPVTVLVSMLVPRGDREAVLHFPVLRPFVHFLSVYLLGIAFAVHRAQTMAFCRRFALPLAFAALSMLVAQFCELPGGSRYAYFQKLLWIGPLLVWLERSASWPRPVTRALDWLGTHSFTLYFLHMPILLLCTGSLFRHKSETLGNSVLALLSMLLVVVATQRMPPLFARARVEVSRPDG